MTDAVADPTVDLAGLPAPDDRGILDIAPAVAEKIARRVTSEVEGARGPVRADAELGRGSARLDLELRVEYPRPVRKVAADVQRRVASRVRELTGLAVDAVDVTVTELPTPPRQARRLA